MAPAMCDRSPVGLDAPDAPWVTTDVAAVLRAPPDPTRLTVDAGDRRWSVLEWTGTKADPLVVLHGITSSSATWWRVGPAIAATGFRVLAPDLPGHGLTGNWRGRHAFADTAGEVASLMRSLGLPIDVPVVGHSWGALVAAALPAAGPRPRRLVLLDPPELSMADLEAMVSDPSDVPYPDIESAVAAVRAASPDWYEGDVLRKAEALTQFEEAASRDVLLLNGALDAGVAGLASWSADGVETWLVRGDPAHGGLTPDAAVERLTRFIDPGRVLTIPGGEHSPHRVLPEATTAALLRALGRA